MNQKMQQLAKILEQNVQDTDLTGSRDAPNVSTLPSDVALFAVKEAIPLLQELQEKHQGVLVLTA